ncbi:MAG TPA: BRCT domain-containing protein [Allosphingosinicella sp.]|nr:BRCT domain-containing protein [Allosphingosinicella sp.]
MKSETLLNRYGAERISSRQIDELTGLARGLCADGVLNQLEIEFLQTWLAANGSITDSPVIADLYSRVAEVLSDGAADEVECRDLLQTLQDFSGGAVELGEALKSTTLPLCDPAPSLEFPGRTYCFTGTFSYGRRPRCEQAVVERGGSCGSLTLSTDVLVIGIYATESWKHSSFGRKILKAAEMRDSGVPISIVSEEHWANHL